RAPAREPLLASSRHALPRPRQVHERAVELQLSGEAAAAFERVVQLREPHYRVAELVRREVGRLLVQLLDVEAALPELLGGLARRDARGAQCLAPGDAGDVVRQQADGSRQRVARRHPGTGEDALARRE